MKINQFKFLNLTTLTRVCFIETLERESRSNKRKETDPAAFCLQVSSNL